MRKKKDRQNRFLLIILTTLLSLSALGAFIYFALIYLDNTNNFITQVADLALERTQLKIDNWLALKVNTIKMAASNSGPLKDKPEELLDIYKRAIISDLEIADIYMTSILPPSSSKGFLYAASGWVPPADYDWTTRPWFKLAVNTDKAIITDPYVDARTGKLTFSIAMRIMQDGKIVGVISSDIFMTTINDLANDSKVTEHSQINILNSRGIYFTNINLSKIGYGDFFKEFPIYNTLRADIFTGWPLIRTIYEEDSYFASIALSKAPWFLVATGRLSDYHNTARTLFSLAAIMLLLLGSFIFLLIRSWKSYTQLQTASGMLERTNVNLEQTIADRTSSLRNILDSAGEGFFTFGKSITVDTGYSKGCLDIFGKDISGLNAAELLFAGQTELATEFRQGFDLYFKGKTKADIIFDLAEKMTTINNKIVSIGYKETSSNKILCILKDITLETKVKEKTQQETDRNQRLLRSLQHRHFFMEYMGLTEGLFAMLDVFETQPPSQGESEGILRTIHAFTDNSGFFSFTETQKAAYSAETTIGDSLALKMSIPYKEISNKLKRSFYGELKAVTEIMGDNWAEETSSVNIPRDVFHKIVQYVRTRLPTETKLQHYLDYYRKIPLVELFTRLPFIASATAEKLGKQIAPMRISGGTMRVLPERYNALAEASVYIVSNMVDQHIEYAYEREAVQKLPQGTIELNITSDRDNINFEFKDDGRGLNPNEIEERAREAGMLKAGVKYQTDEILGLIFEEGYFSKLGALSVSGRSIGLNIVKSEVLRMGGSIEVRSKLGKGTSIELRIPLNAKL